MTDRELIIDALREYEKTATANARFPISVLGANPETWATRSIDALRIRAELEDNSDYVVRGGA